MMAKLAIRISVATALLCPLIAPRLFANPAAKPAWEAWQAGDVERVAALARMLADDEPTRDEGHHLLFLAAFVSANYDEALRRYQAISSDYAWIGELRQGVLDAYLHLGQYAEAEKFARQQKFPQWQVELLARRNEHPLKTILHDLTIVPYAEHPLADYFPPFPAALNGHPVTAHVDTGGTFLVMGPKRAQKLGINVTLGGTGFHGPQPVKMYHGLAKSFQLGDAVIENVPVTVLPSLRGPQDFIIFGTNVLEQFLATLDYPNRRLILSPRRHDGLRQKHLSMLPERRTEVPFAMWGDHYMFARGAVGKNDGLNFFIDSGLVSLHPGENGTLRQAAFTTSKQRLLQWGFEAQQVAAGVFESSLPLRLGSLEQSGHLIVPGPVGSRSFGGVRIDGLLSHAFLKRYAWTLDFDLCNYIFSE